MADCKLSNKGLSAQFEDLKNVTCIPCVADKGTLTIVDNKNSTTETRELTEQELEKLLSSQRFLCKEFIDHLEKQTPATPTYLDPVSKKINDSFKKTHPPEKLPAEITFSSNTHEIDRLLDERYGGFKLKNLDPVTDSYIEFGGHYRTDKNADLLKGFNLRNVEPALKLGLQPTDKQKLEFSIIRSGDKSLETFNLSIKIEFD